MRGQLLWSGGVSAEASLGPAMASAPSSLPPAVSRLLGEQLQVKGRKLLVQRATAQDYGIFIWRRFHMPRLEWK